jgi:SAM-dependent methyltransferase
MRDQPALTVRHERGKSGLHRSTYEFYESNADAYAELTLAGDVAELWSLLDGRVTPGSRVLDLGAGAGRDLKELRSRGYRAIGMDLSLALATIAKRVSCQPMVVADMHALPFRPASFDVVWSVASLSHIHRDEISALLQSIRAVLRTGGIFIVSVREGTGDLIDTKGRYFSLHREDDWHNLMIQSGFSVEHCGLSIKPPVVINETAQPISWIVSVASR